MVIFLTGAAPHYSLHPQQFHFMSPTFIAIISVLAAIFLCEFGSSLLGILQPIRGLQEGFPSYGIGTIGIAYYFGFILGCLIIPRLIKRFGHIRTFSAFAAIAGSSALLNGFIIDIIAWFLLRIIFGFCMAGLFTVAESWLNELADPKTRGRIHPKTRGRILAGYMVAVWFAVLSGKLLFSIQDPSDVLPFAIVSILISLSLVPVALTMGVTPEQEEAVRFRPRDTFEAAPIGVVTCFLIGMINGALWVLAPIYAQVQTQSTASVGIFMAVLVFGGALAQWPIGKLSGLVDRRWVILISSMIASAFGIGLATLQSIDHLGLFAYTAAIHVLIASYAAWRMFKISPVSKEERGSFTAVPQTTPQVFEMKPTSASEKSAQTDK